MATQRRSVWEIRFYALKHQITNEITWKKRDIIDAVLKKETIQQAWINKINYLSLLEKKAQELETKSASEIFLVRDY